MTVAFASMALGYPAFPADKCRRARLPEVARGQPL
jgi:hypothetical protein